MLKLPHTFAPASEWIEYLVHQPLGHSKCDFYHFTVADHLELVKRAPRFLRLVKSDKLLTLLTCELLDINILYGQYVPVEKLSGKAWCLILTRFPFFSPSCDWSKLSGDDWVELLLAQPGFIEECDWSLIRARGWYRLLNTSSEYLQYMTYSQIRTLERVYPDTIIDCIGVEQIG